MDIEGGVSSPEPERVATRVRAPVARFVAAAVDPELFRLDRKMEGATPERIQGLLRSATEVDISALSRLTIRNHDALAPALHEGNREERKRRMNRLQRGNNFVASLDALGVERSTDGIGYNEEQLHEMISPPIEGAPTKREEAMKAKMRDVIDKMIDSCREGPRSPIRMDELRAKWLAINEYIDNPLLVEAAMADAILKMSGRQKNDYIKGVIGAVDQSMDSWHETQFRDLAVESAEIPRGVIEYQAASEVGRRKLVVLGADPELGPTNGDTYFTPDGMRLAYKHPDSSTRLTTPLTDAQQAQQAHEIATYLESAEIPGFSQDRILAIQQELKELISAGELGGLAIVAGGLGAYDGEVASTLGTLFVTDYILSHLNEDQEGEELLRNAIHYADKLLKNATDTFQEKLFDKAKAQFAIYNSPKASLAIALTDKDGKTYLANGGNARSYKRNVRTNTAEQLSTDHSLASRAVLDGQISPVELLEYRYDSSLAFGTGVLSDDDITTSTTVLSENEELIMCTVGGWTGADKNNPVVREELGEIDKRFNAHLLNGVPREEAVKIANGEILIAGNVDEVRGGELVRPTAAQEADLTEHLVRDSILNTSDIVDTTVLRYRTGKPVATQDDAKDKGKKDGVKDDRETDQAREAREPETRRRAAELARRTREDGMGYIDGKFPARFEAHMPGYNQAQSIGGFCYDERVTVETGENGSIRQLEEVFVPFGQIARPRIPDNNERVTISRLGSFEEARRSVGRQELPAFLQSWVEYDYEFYITHHTEDRPVTVNIRVSVPPELAAEIDEQLEPSPDRDPTFMYEYIKALYPGYLGPSPQLDIARKPADALLIRDLRESPNSSVNTEVVPYSHEPADAKDVLPPPGDSKPERASSPEQEKTVGDHTDKKDAAEVDPAIVSTLASEIRRGQQLPADRLAEGRQIAEAPAAKDSKDAPEVGGASERRPERNSRREAVEGSSSVTGIGISSEQGLNPIMGDAYNVIQNFEPGQSLVAIYDSHGGTAVATYLEKTFPRILRLGINSKMSRSELLKETFLITNDELREDRDVPSEHVGATACAVLVDGSDIFVAGLGDTRVVLDNNGEAEQLTVNYRITDKDEQRRIRTEKGIVAQDENRNSYVVGPGGIGIAISRAFGDHGFPGVSAKPSLEQRRIKPGYRRLIAASDGLWDVMTNEDAVRLISNIDDPQEASNLLREEAGNRWRAILDRFMSAGRFEEAAGIGENIVVAVVGLESPDVKARVKHATSRRILPTRTADAPDVREPGGRGESDKEGKKRRSRMGPEVIAQRKPVPLTSARNLRRELEDALHPANERAGSVIIPPRVLAEYLSRNPQLLFAEGPAEFHMRIDGDTFYIEDSDFETIVDNSRKVRKLKIHLGEARFIINGKGKFVLDTEHKVEFGIEGSRYARRDVLEQIAAIDKRLHSGLAVNQPRYRCDVDTFSINGSNIGIHYRKTDKRR
jgi:protein phosphatase 1L